MAGLHLVIAVAAFVAVAIANPSPLGFQIPDKIEKACAKKLEPVAIESAKLFYTLGAKANGNRQIATNTYNSGVGYCLDDYETQFNYIPTANQQTAGPLNITYVEITVTQNSATSNVYVTAGGIGEKYMSIFVEGKNTTYLGVQAIFYGR